jgi:hypothetical protein
MKIQIVKAGAKQIKSKAVCPFYVDEPPIASQK